MSKKKLSDLKENEYVYCETEKEIKRVFGKVDAFIFYNNKGEHCLIQSIAEKGNFIVQTSKNIADYDSHVQKKPKRDIIINANSRNGEYIKALEAYSDHLEQIIKDKDKYIAHMELEAAETSQKKLCPLCDGSGRRIFPNTNPPIDKPCPNCSNQ